MYLTIITINYNNFEGLKKTFDSVFNQTNKDFEYIVIDGGSTDGSKELIEAHKNKIDYWLSEPDTGIYNAMNKGIKVAKGEYLLMLNSGDWLADCNVVDEVNTIVSKRNDDLICCNFFWIINDKLVGHEGYPELTYRFFRKFTLAHQATLIKKNLHNKVGFYDELLRIASDWKFFILSICKHNATYSFCPLKIAVCNREGLSWNPEWQSKINSEKEFVLNRYFHPFEADYEKIQQIEMELQNIKSNILYKSLKKIKSNFTGNNELLTSIQRSIKFLFINVPEPPLQPEFIKLQSFPNHVKDSGKIPATIWMYWESEKVSNFVNKCVENIKKICKNFKVVMITPTNLHNYVDCFPTDISFETIQAKSDLIRLAVLKEHGGIWLDATTMVTTSLDWIIEAQQHHEVEFIGFYNPEYMNSDLPFVESWALAAIPKCSFIIDWYNEFLLALRSGNFKNHYKTQDYYFLIKQKLPVHFEDYLVIHLAAQKVLLSKKYNILTYDCTQEGLFYRYVTTPKENGKMYAKYLLGCTGPGNISKIIKFTGGDRIALQEYLKNTKPKKSSILCEYNIID